MALQSENLFYDLIDEPEHPKQMGKVDITYQQAANILSNAAGFIGSYDFTLNPYIGCAFACSYCYSANFTQTEEERDTWGQWVKVKENAVKLMEKRRAGALDGKTIYMASATDPYQPVERKLKLTRGILEALIRKHKPKLVVQTRSPDVIRDCDLFKRLELNGGRVRVNMTVTTDNDEIRRIFEPGCPTNAARLKAIAEVTAQGIDTCITMTPLLVVDNPHRFVEALLATGVKRFITQPFRFQTGQFTATTRQPAIDAMAAYLNSDPVNFVDRYLEHYRTVYRVLEAGLPYLGEGREGFRPPF